MRRQLFKKIFLTTAVSGLLLQTGAAFAATEIHVWHAMVGAPDVAFAELAQRFNDQQQGVHVTLDYKGDAEITVNSALAAVREAQAKQAKPGIKSKKRGKEASEPIDASLNAEIIVPDLLQVEDDLGENLLGIKGAAKPLAEVLALNKSPDFALILPVNASLGKDAKGQAYGFPLLTSVPLFIYNKDAYRKAGLDPNAAPNTWRELQAQLLALKNPNTEITCGYTTSDQAAIHVENLAAINGALVATRNNGLDGPGAQLVFNDLLHVRHTALMESWVKSQLFTVSGSGKEGDVRFASGECASLTSASTVLGDLQRNAKFAYGVALLPLYDEAASKPQNLLVNGSSLWVMSGKKPGQYKAIAEFLAYLATPVIAAEWHQKTGSLPLTRAAFLASEKSALYEKITGLDAVMSFATSPGVTRNMRLPQYAKVHQIIDLELEEVWADHKPPVAGLNDAVRLGNAAMKGDSPSEAKGKKIVPASGKGPRSAS